MPDLKAICRADKRRPSTGLAGFEDRWSASVRPSDQSSRQAWEHVVPLFALSLSKIIKTRGRFPNDDAAIKLLHLAIQNAGIHWRRPIEWTAAMGQFAVFSATASRSQFAESVISDPPCRYTDFQTLPEAAVPQAEIQLTGSALCGTWARRSIKCASPNTHVSAAKTGASSRTRVHFAIALRQPRPRRKRLLALLPAASKRRNTTYLLKEFRQTLELPPSLARRCFDDWRASLKWQCLEPSECLADMINRH
jgi:hypothetical protein